MKDKQIERTKKTLLEIVIPVLSIILTFIAAVAAVESVNIAKVTSAPFFTLTTEVDDNNNWITILRNEGGAIRSVQCRRVCYVRVIGQKGDTQRDFYILVDLNNNRAKYDYETHEIVLSQSMLNDSVSFAGLYEQLWRFNLDESLYEEWAESNGKQYTTRSINVDDVENCILIEYRDYRDKYHQVVLRITESDYEIWNAEDVPKIAEGSTFTLGVSTAYDVCKYVLDKLDIKYTFTDNTFTFIR